MIDKNSQKTGDAAPCQQAQSEYIAMLEAKLIEQANEILKLKRMLNGIVLYP